MCFPCSFEGVKDISSVFCNVAKISSSDNDSIASADDQVPEIPIATVGAPYQIHNLN